MRTANALCASYLLTPALLLLLLGACEPNAPAEAPLFRQVAPEASGVDFVNRIEERADFNILVDEFMYNGGGVGLGDFDGDGLADLYFAGNVEGNRLYLNRGDFHFEDVTKASGTAAADVWSSSITTLDFDNDGQLDIYVSATHDADPARRRNKLFLNQGPGTDGIPRFVDEAATYGLADTGHTTQTVFFDYDRDGDLDLYLLHDIYILQRSSTIKSKVTDGSSPTTDKLLRNNGDGTYTDVSHEAGIHYEGFGLSIAVVDINRDDYPDLYISNDFITNDVLYVNNGDGTFTNRIGDYLRHQSYSSMGSDVADVNGDGLLDIMTLDMLPHTNQRVKQMLPMNRYNFYELLEQRGYEMQYVRNCLQINNGRGPDGDYRFSDLSLMAGVAATDWSWSVLLADYDNDRRKDIFISNGFPRDVTDMDFAEFRSGNESLFADTSELLAQIPRVKIRNFLYHNRGNLYFDDVSEAWGFEAPSFSNGAAYGDLDNDGDLDLVVNNINDPAFVYENRAAQQYPERRSLRVTFEGPPLNKGGIGALVTLEYDGHLDYYEHYPTRGYISCMAPFVLFGLGEAAVVDRLTVRWPDGREQVLEDVPADQPLQLDYTAARPPVAAKAAGSEAPPPLFDRVEADLGLDFRHSDLRFTDFRVQPLLPHLHSQDGPGLAVADVDGNGLEDLFAGNGRRHSGVLFLQQPDGRFEQRSLGDEADSEDLGVLFFDADGDADADLYIVSGSSEFRAYDPKLRDRLFLNDGAGRFTLAADAVPDLTFAGSTVNAADFDRDGDLDLFIGGRLVPQSYPLPERSALLRNDTRDGRAAFADATEALAPGLLELGMVSAALWTDYDNDGWVDLLVAGEWMPLTFFHNEEGRLVKADLLATPSGGWWNSIAAADFDHDGDLDYVLGNQGLNNSYRATASHPLRIYAKDFDGNGSLDHVIGAYTEGAYRPIHPKKDLVKQLNLMRRRFPRYELYGQATMDDLFSEEEMEGAYSASVHMLESAYLENRGAEGFELTPLPRSAQVAPLYGLLADDFTGDGHPDILAGGNKYGAEFITGYQDASIGLLLAGDGRGGFAPLPAQKSGFLVAGDAKGLVQLAAADGRRLLVAGQNRERLLAFRRDAADSRLALPARPMDYRAEIVYQDGRREMRELYYGASFLSGSSRTVWVDPSVVREVRWRAFNGASWTWRPAEPENVSLME